ncbi:MAG: sulfotransferase domain-containing protein [Candidatus Omnitrophota bacterium]
MPFVLFLLIVSVACAATYAALMSYVKWYVAWENSQRHGMNYYGKTLAERRQIRRRMKLYSLLMPAAIGMEQLFRATTKKVPGVPSVEFQGMTAPPYSCTRESLEKAKAYQPQKGDVFVTTQMKCGTTWMQQIVYEILNHGKGDLTEKGAGHLCAVSPWLESIDGIPVEKAPLVGEEKRRVIKTHLPISFCYHAAAKYIYVTRHPASCFASILDYFKLMSGRLAPPKERLLEWYCSERMWFSPWPDHAAGWWMKSREADNVLFLSFEEMKRDLPGAVRKAAQFLGVTLSGAEVDAVARKSGFDAMKTNEEYFEMSPPNFCAVRGSYFVDGSSSRHEAVSAADRRKIRDFCISRLDAKTMGLLDPYLL